VHNALGDAAVLIESSRAFVYSALRDVWAALESGEAATVEQRVRLRLAITHAHDACARAVQQLYHLAGSLAVYTPNVLDRCFRDIHTADQHVIATVSVYEAAGKSMLTGKLPPLW
jgi:alkylation response protein AidB-like acyl-CoA dehydrogenase